MKNLPLLLCCLVSLPTLLRANGGGYLRGGLAKSGNVELFEPSGTEKVAILDEELIITPRPNSASVHIKYQMKNLTDKPVKVEFGFPIEEMKGKLDYQPEGQKKSMVNKPEYCRNYKITLSDSKQPGVAFRSNNLKTKEVVEPTEAEGTVPDVAGWLVSTASFAAGEEKTLTISYESDYPRDVSFISSTGFRDAGVFAYRLSTGACWAGPIRHGRVIVEPWEFMDSREIRVLKPVNRFAKQGKKWIWEFNDLEPTLADDLQIEMEPEERSYASKTAAGEEVANTRNAKRGERWEMVHTNYSVKASSTLPPEGKYSYEAENVKSWSCWAEGAKGNGVGEWLEIRPDVPSVVSAIYIQGGFSGREESLGAVSPFFTANARPKRARLDLNGGEKSYEIDFKDEAEPQRFVLPNYSKPVEKLKLTFLEVYPGTRFEDLCVSRITLVSSLAKAPKIWPSR